MGYPLSQREPKTSPVQNAFNRVCPRGLPASGGYPALTSRAKDFPRSECL